VTALQFIQVVSLELKRTYPNPEQTAKRILMHELKLDNTELLLNLNRDLTDFQTKRCLGFIAAMKKQIPVGYLLGYTHFYGVKLTVNRHVLVPRPDTEAIVEAVLQSTTLPKTAKILDMGTGSGAIAIALKKERPQFDIHAIDNSCEALKVAKQNALANDCDITFYCSNWFSDVFHNFDCIVANPPYIDSHSSSLQYLKAEPQSSLVAEQSGFSDLIHIIENSPNYLKKHGQIYLEHSTEQSMTISKLLTNIHFDNIKAIYDLSNCQRGTSAIFSRY